MVLLGRIVALGNDDADRQSPRRYQCEDIGLRQEGENRVRRNHAEPAPQTPASPLQFHAESYYRRSAAGKREGLRALVSSEFHDVADERIEHLSERSPLRLRRPYRRPQTVTVHPGIDGVSVGGVVEHLDEVNLDAALDQRIRCSRRDALCAAGPEMGDHQGDALWSCRLPHRSRSRILVGPSHLETTRRPRRRSALSLAPLTASASSASHSAKNLSLPKIRWAVRRPLAPMR